ncbi:MAG: polymer-forming cytoskeletal protein [Rickettsiales bacterium]|jgi:cytoskeletal protein CcmA (bactofilin family)|nr:polymer-forming cytoskeletal protein [Rickettsiales bacterium]
MLKWFGEKLGKKEPSSPTIVGAGAEFVGDIVTDHMVHIQGDFEGRINADAVIIGKLGKVQGRIDSNSVYIYGEMAGTIVTGDAHIFAGANVSGDLQYFSLNIANNEGVDCRLVRRKKTAK